MTVMERAALWVLRVWGRPLHSFQLTLARAILALSTLITLSFNSSNTILHSAETVEPTPTSCEAVASLGAFCVSPFDAEITRLLLIISVLPAVLGVLPAVSAPLHSYVAFTVAQNTVGIEGGDYLIATVSLLLVVVCITDRRVNGWRTRVGAAPRLRYIPGGVVFVALQVQIAYVYIEAATVKQAHPVWAEGSALWYWAQHPTFGARPEIREALAFLFAHPVALQTATWGVIVVEYVLAFAVLAARRRGPRWMTLGLGVGLHLAFAVVLGLVTFGISMLGVLLLISWRSGDAVPWRIFRALRPRRTATVGISSEVPA